MKPNFDAMTKAELKAYLVSHQDEQAAFYAFVDRFTEEAPQELFPPVTSEAEIQEVVKLGRAKSGANKNELVR